jgi:hypothetical protein
LRTTRRRAYAGFFLMRKERQLYFNVTA